MKYKITFREFEYRDGYKMPVPVLEETINYFGNYIHSLRTQIIGKDKEYNLEFNNYFLSGLEKVLSGQSDYEERANEGTLIKIKPDMTEVTDNFGLNLYYAQIETKELYNLCLEWIKILDEYYSKYPDRLP